MGRFSTGATVAVKEGRHKERVNSETASTSRVQWKRSKAYADTRCAIIGVRYGQKAVVKDESMKQTRGATGDGTVPNRTDFNITRPHTTTDAVPALCHIHVH